MPDTEKYDYIIRNDPRIPDVAEGCILQALAYYETGEAFCTDRSCRLYNAHWQSDLIRTQVTDPAFCDRHLEIMNQMKERRDRGCRRPGGCPTPALSGNA